ncbi:MAG: archemetzincin [Thermoprotei archaeon]|nr:MAG: archemetzincin [Thermoprotei archaeon]RLF19671.1 MAG: archemetzincin [Thermoprotei archaeon]
MKPSILLQPLGDVDKNLLYDTCRRLQRIIDVNVDVSDIYIEIPEEAFDNLRGQYLSTTILHHLKIWSVKLPYDKIVGISNVDAYTNGLNFVFGEAELGGRVAVVYLARLRPEFYGGEPNYELFVTRCLKEILHELGHTFGLLHCRNRRCVMTFSNSIYDTDYKEANYCRNCSAYLLRNGVRVLNPL